MAEQHGALPATPVTDPADASPALSGVARIEHSLQSLLELGRELTVSLDLYETADLLIFNLMGQLGTGRTALWLIPEGGAAAPVLIRCHGFDRAMLSAAAGKCGSALLARFVEKPAPVLLSPPSGSLGPEFAELSRTTNAAVLAPLFAHGEILGWLALGSKLDGSRYTDADLQVLQAALGMVGVALQNTRLHNQMLDANRELRASNEHFQELDRLKSEFLRNVNHELRTPLAVVMATLECVVNVGTGDERVQSMLTTAHRRARDLHELLEQLLTFSSAMNSRLAIELAEEDLGGLLRAYCEQRLPGVTAGLRELVFSCEPGLPRARCDRQRVIQILDQLMDNALKFTPSGAHLRLRAGKLLDSGRHWVRVELEDDGPGIPAERIHAVFNSFEQVDGSPTRAVGGLGMGLALARELAERMECRLGVKSAVGQGSTFALLLPAA